MVTDSEHSPTTIPPFCTEGWRIDPVLLRATRNGVEHQIEPKLIGVLCVLAQRQGEVVTRKDLFDTVWAGTIVSDDNLTRAISMLRRLFGDTAREQRVIETLPRVGYRFLALVEWETVREPSRTAPREARPARSQEVAPLRRRWGKAVLAGVGAVGLAVVAVLSIWTRDVPARTTPVTPIRVTSEAGLEFLGRLSPDGTRAMYARSAGQGTDLYVLSFDGGSGRQLTTSGGALYSAWSPDGETVAFIDRQHESCRVALVSALGGPPRDLAPCPGDAVSCSLALCPALDWSPDGRHLASSARTEEGTELVLLDASTGHLSEIPYDWAPGGDDSGPRFSPDGQTLLFSRVYEDGSRQLLTLRLSDGSVHPLSSPSDDVVTYDWVDDATILYAKEDGDATTIWTRPLGGGDPIWVALTKAGGRPDVAEGRLMIEQWDIDGGLYAVDSGEAFAPRNAFEWLPSFSPDGERIAFVSDRSGTHDVWVADASGLRSERVSEGIEVLPDTPRWSPDGQRLVFAALAGGNQDVFVVDQIGQPARRIARVGSSERMPSWSPDGRWLYVASDRDGDTDIWRLSPDGTVMERLTSTGASAGLASPDGAWFYTVRAGEPGLWRRPLGGEEDVLVHPAAGLAWSEAWIPVAGGVYLAESRPTGSASILWVPIEGGSEQVALVDMQQSLAGLAVAPDGQIIVGRVDQTECDLALVELDDLLP